MASLELIPFTEVDPVASAAAIYGLLHEERTASQLGQFLPSFYARYGNTVEQGTERFAEMADASRDHPGFLPMVQAIGDEIIGTATVDDRLRAYGRPAVGEALVELPLVGPSTSSWIAAPYQGLGYGKQSLERRIRIATDAWSRPGVWVKVMDVNERSRRNVLGRGFRRVHEAPVWIARTLHANSSIYQYLASEHNRTAGE